MHYILDGFVSDVKFTVKDCFEPSGVEGVELIREFGKFCDFLCCTERVLMEIMECCPALQI
jgi:hypothetical protein